jgi:hypothetical protein
LEYFISPRGGRGGGNVGIGFIDFQGLWEGTEAKRDRVYCAQALLDILEEPADLTSSLSE